MVTNEDLIKESYDIAVLSLKNFIKNLELDINDFSHIYNIPIEITTLAPTDFSSYNPKQNIIKINKDILNKYIIMKEKRINLELIKNIVKEMLHANRTITAMDPETKKETRDIICSFYTKKPGEDEEYLTERIEQQTSLEEVITKTLAEFIIKSRKDEYFDFEENNDYIQKSTDNPEIIIGLKIIEVLGENPKEALKWFMTSAYTQNYQDLFEETFQEQYDDLLYYVNDIYVSTYCNESIDINSIYEIETIVEERKKITKKKK